MKDLVAQAPGDRQAQPSGPPGPDEPAEATPTGPSPYSTGGGGTIFELRVGALYLSFMLAEESALGFRTDHVVAEVAFQQKGQGYPLDDLLVTAAGPGGKRQSIELAMRHRPGWIPSAPKFVDLMRALVEAEETHRELLASDEHRLGIVHLAGDPSSDQVRELTNLARNSKDPANFLDLLAAQPRPIRERHRHIRTTLTKVTAADTDRLLFRLLRSLWVVPMAVEGEPARDLDEGVNRLRRVCADGIENAATAIFSELVNAAQETATRGGTLDRPTLRRRVGLVAALKRSKQVEAAWRRLEAIGRLAEAGVNETLAGTLTLDRSELARQIREGAAVGPVVVTGDPGVGKSAVARQLLRSHRDKGGYALLLDLRELGSPKDFLQLVGAPLDQVLADAVSALPPLLVIDRCEAVLEERASTLRLVLSATSGWSVVMVGRREGAARTLEIVGSELGSDPNQVAVQAFTAAEMQQVRTTFPQLRPLLQQGRTATLLARPYLLDMVLRDSVRSKLPGGPLAEADVMQAVWAGLVRRNEEVVPGLSPEGREQNLLQLARAHLGGTSADAELPDTSALAGLRSDGLLRALETSGISRPEDFGHDVVRDFAVAELMLRTGSAREILRQRGAPRWALYAARLYCQATLAANGGALMVASFIALSHEFASIAEEQGRRWADVPYEALLTLGDPRAALEAVWSTLVGPEEPTLHEVLAVARRRFTTRQGELPQLAVWIPALAAVLDHLQDVDESIHAVLLEWIRELLAAAALREYAGIGSVLQLLGGPLVAQLESYLLSRLGHRREDEAALEGLSLLASGIGPSTCDQLRLLADERPDELDAVVDEPLAAELLARHQPDLLLELSDAYYIRKRRRRSVPPTALSFLDDDDGFDDLDMGVRHHSHHGIGFPFAGHDYGPFSALLKQRPEQTIELIKRLVDHSSRTRSRSLSSLQSGDRPSTSIDVGGGARPFVGDDHVYAWYRGLGVGPYPAMSALLALERHLDGRFAGGDALSDLANLVLEGASSLAFVGLWVGLLVRHLELVTDELDPFLGDPNIWHLEAVRVTREHGNFRAQREDKTERPEQRFWTFSQVAGYIALKADTARQTALAEVRQQLRDRPEAERAVLDLWAGQLDPATYRINRVGDQLVVQHQPQPDVEAALEPSRRERDVAGLVHRCMYTYSRYCHGEAELDKVGVRSDLSAIQALTDADVQAHGGYILHAAGAVASAALLAAHHGEIEMDPQELAGATETVLELAEMSPSLDQSHGAVSSEAFPMGFDRCIARAMPLLLLGAEQATAAEASLVRLAQSPFDEVGRSLATGLEVVWGMPCIDRGGRCVHQAALRVAEEMARCLVMGPWSDQGFRPRQRLEGELPKALGDLPPRDLYMHSSAGPVMALDGCARSGACTASLADELELTLMAKFADAWVDWASHEGYVDVSDAQGVHAVAAARALDGDERSLRILESTYRAHGALMGSVLECLPAVATTPGRQVRLRALWPGLMESAVSGIESGDFKDRDGQRDLLRVLLPIQPGGVPVESWPAPADIHVQVERVIALGLASSDFTSALSEYLQQQALEAQISTGLQWMLSIITSRADRLARRTRAPLWLESLRQQGAAQLKGEALSRWFRIVDLLAAHGDQRCVSLQLLEE